MLASAVAFCTARPSLIQQAFHVATRPCAFGPSRLVAMVQTRSMTHTGTAAATKADQQAKHRPAKRARTVKRQTTEELDEEFETREFESPRPRKKGDKAIEDLMESALPERRDSPWKVGAHVSGLGGVENTVVNAAAIGANAFAIFVKSQRKWTSPPLSAESIALFRERMEKYGYTNDVVLPHGSYLINMGNPNAEKREKSFECFVDDLKRCEALGLKYYNFHPGSTVGGATPAESISHIADCINRAHKETSTVVVVLENMAGAGNIIGSDFQHLGQIISHVQDKSRVGVCLDTCHTFAAGYDIRTKQAWDDMLQKFDTQVGLSYLRGMHLNDSKAEYDSKRDRHQNIGMGHLGLTTFHHILNDPRVQNIPLVLETPNFERPRDVWATEIETLYQLSGLDMNSADLESMAGRIESAIGKDLMANDASKPSTAKTKRVKASKSGKRKARPKDESREDDDGTDEAEGK